MSLHSRAVCFSQGRTESLLTECYPVILSLQAFILHYMPGYSRMSTIMFGRILLEMD
jgi:hypothetical protein